MERHVAERLVEIVLRLDGPLNEAAEVIERLPNLEEKKVFRRGIAEITGRLYTDLIVPIVRQYPDLDPVKE